MNKNLPPAEECNETAKLYPELFRQIDPAALPYHVAIIMDGNGRWAGARSIPRIMGHKEGVRSVDEVVACARETGVRVLTLYAFSVENWQRPRTEVRALMGILKEYIKRKVRVMQENGIRFQAIGRIHDLPENIQELLHWAERETSANQVMTLNLALSYGGRAEILDAVRSLAQDVADGRIRPSEIDEAVLSSRMYTRDCPDPDLIIRTSGEQRISNFLTWQSVYTELYFTPILWPDFKRKAFLEALLDYRTRERRYGMTGEQVKEGE
ncbi:MAG: isoprenyl transferase [Deltaproteobacteria bacterium]|nr:isoprenyl transferase [Deltaproteobacteria bacterium]